VSIAAPIQAVQSAVKRGLARLTYAFRPKRSPIYAEDLVEFVKGEFDRRRQERRLQELQWRLNRAFIDGNHYLDINTLRLDLVETPSITWWEQREVFNHIAPIVETRIARLGRMQAKLAVRPATGEMSDMSRAKVAKKLLDSAERGKLPISKRQDYLAWLETTGTVFLKNTWDPTAGRVIGYAHVDAVDDQPEPAEDRTERPQSDDLMAAGQMISEQLGKQSDQQEIPVQVEIDAQGARGRTIVAVYEGDVQTDVVSPFEIYPDSILHPDMESVHSIIHARAYPVSVIQETWGREVAPESQIESWGLQRNTVPGGGLGYGAGGFHLQSVQLKDHALVLEYWERPSAEYPEGRFIVVAGDSCLYSGPLPFMVDEDGEPGLPFVRTVASVRPGWFFGSCVTERLIPIQRRFNAWMNRRAEYLARVAIGQMVAVEGSVTDVTKFEEDAGAPGTVHWIRPGFDAPKYIDFPSLPASFEQEGPLLLHQFTMISGVSETTRMSEAPPGVKSGVALDRVIEQDNTRLSHTVENIEGSHVQWGKQVLRLYKQFAANQRILRTTGDDNSVDIMYWDSSDITSDDVVIETSALLSDTPAQRKQLVMDLLGAGFYNDPETGRLSREGRAKVAEQLQFGNWEQATDIDELHMKRAEKENRMMSQGQMPLPKTVDNEELHIARHAAYMLTDEFEQLNQESQGALEMMVNQHIQDHTLLLREKRLALMAEQPMVLTQGGGETNVS